MRMNSEATTMISLIDEEDQPLLSVACEICVRVENFVAKSLFNSLSTDKFDNLATKSYTATTFSKKFSIFAGLKSGESITCDKLSLATIVMRR